MISSGNGFLPHRLSPVAAAAAAAAAWEQLPGVARADWNGGDGVLGDADDDADGEAENEDEPDCDSAGVNGLDKGWVLGAVEGATAITGAGRRV